VTKRPGEGDLDTVARPVVGVSLALQRGETDVHRHRKSQLMYVLDGLITLETGDGLWVVPPRCAIWIPSGIDHFARAAGPIHVAGLYVQPELVASLGGHCRVLFVQPLLRELVIRFAGPEHRGDAGREQRLAMVLVDELLSAPEQPLHLPMPMDRRLRRLAEAMLEAPSERLTAEQWGDRVGASQRTLARLFQRDTGMSFGRWRQQLQVGLALQHLAAGESVTQVGLALGYESTSAFIAMFRRLLGTTPARYFDAPEATAPSSG